MSKPWWNKPDKPEEPDEKQRDELEQLDQTIETVRNKENKLRSLLKQHAPEAEAKIDEPQLKSPSVIQSGITPGGAELTIAGALAKKAMLAQLIKGTIAHLEMELLELNVDCES